MFELAPGGEPTGGQTYTYTISYATSSHPTNPPIAPYRTELEHNSGERKSPEVQVRPLSLRLQPWNGRPSLPPTGHLLQLPPHPAAPLLHLLLLLLPLLLLLLLLVPLHPRGACRQLHPQVQQVEKEMLKRDELIVSEGETTPSWKNEEPTIATLQAATRSTPRAPTSRPTREFTQVCPQTALYRWNLYFRAMKYRLRPVSIAMHSVSICKRWGISGTSLGENGCYCE